MHEKITTFERVFEDVERQSQNCFDELVPVESISFDSLDTMRIGLERHHLEENASRQICNRLSIPYPYMARCDEGLAALNMNKWIKREKNNELFVRFNGNAIRALFTPRYSPVDNFTVMEQLAILGVEPDTKVQATLDDNFFSLSITDQQRAFNLNGKDRHFPGVSISNSETGRASLSISGFIMRLVCLNGLIARQRVKAHSYRHVSDKVLELLPDALANASRDTEQQQKQFQFSLQSEVDDPLATISSFNKQFQVSETGQDATVWAWPQEAGGTMFHVINTYTRAAQYHDLSAEESFHLQRVGGEILSLVDAA